MNRILLHEEGVLDLDVGDQTCCSDIEGVLSSRLGNVGHGRDSASIAIRRACAYARSTS